MKKLFFIALLMTSASAYAADAGAPAAPPPAATAASAGKDFATVKATRLQHIAEKIALYQKAQTCVQAATDSKAMEACYPKSARHWFFHHKAQGTAAAPAQGQ